MYREYNDVVPDYLHGKPRSVVLHCLERKARSNRYDDEDIVLSDEDGIFKIKKLDTFKCTVNFLQPSFLYMQRLDTMAPALQIYVCSY